MFVRVLLVKCFFFAELFVAEALVVNDVLYNRFVHAWYLNMKKKATK